MKRLVAIPNVLFSILMCVSFYTHAEDKINALDKALGATNKATTTEQSTDESSENKKIPDDGVLNEDDAEGEKNGADLQSEGEAKTQPEDSTEPQTTVEDGGDEGITKDGESKPMPDGEPQASQGVDTLEGVTCSASGPCIVDDSGLPLRALPRSFTALFDRPGDDATMISNAVSAFKPVFVFGVKAINNNDVTNAQGWYQVGFTNRRAMGWMRAKDIVEWRQALLVEYLHPGVGSSKRSPVLMFDSQEAIANVVTSSSREDDISDMLTDISKGGIPDGVIGKEPAQFLNIDDTFYLLPVVDWKKEPKLAEPSHYLKVFAAVPGARADEVGESTLRDKNYLSEDAFVNVKDSLVDIVFVLDMTGSMQPYIDAVKSSMADLVELIGNSDAEPDKIKFGLVGYRDNTDATPELEWNVKNFTPEFQSADELLKTLDSASAASASSDEWSEDVHGGFMEGVKSSWRSSPLTSSAETDDASARKSVRFMILIGDASGHDKEDDDRGYKNSTGMNVSELRSEAKAKSIYTYTIYLQDERAEPDWKIAQAQFRGLASGETGQGESTYSVFTAGAGENIGETINFIGEKLICRIEEIDGTSCHDSTADSDKSADDDDLNNDSRAMIDIADGLMQAAFADYIGDGAKPPKDFLSWIHDYDLSDPYREALGVRVLITRQQFDNIVRQTSSLVDTIEGVIIGNMDFFVALQTASAKTSLGLDLTADQSLEEQEFLPKWVSSLPYKSAVLAITPQGFANLTPTERKEFQSQLKSKYNAYLEISSSVGRWFKLDEGDDKLQEVVALPLTSLP